jgi:hypothetical protein
MVLHSISKDLNFLKKLFAVGTFVAAFLFVGVITSSSAHAVETTVTGKVSTLTNFESGFVWAETQVSSSWQFVMGSNTEIKSDGNFSIDLEGLSGETVRIVAYVKLSSGSYIKLGDSFTLATGTTTKNLTLGSLNIKVNLTPAIACFGSYFD